MYHRLIHTVKKGKANSAVIHFILDSGMLKKTAYSPDSEHIGGASFMSSKDQTPENEKGSITLSRWQNTSLGSGLFS